LTKVDDVISWAQLELGKNYVYGDEGPDTFDCSGLMQFIFGKVGASLPRTAAEQQAATTRVSSPAPGDLVFWGDPAYHVALYVGGGKIIAAPHSGAKVEIENVWGQPASYGRVAGVGGLAATTVGAVTAVTGPVGDWVQGLLGQGRNVALEAVFVIAGIGLVGYGLYRLARPTITSKVNQVEALL
jgi:cell wall-associated NlpC family hydrolase